jgi:hypothetical protein
MDEWMCENVMLKGELLVDRLVTLDVILCEAYMWLGRFVGAERVHWDRLKRLSGSGWLPRWAPDREVGEVMRGGLGDPVFASALGRMICALAT